MYRFDGLKNAVCDEQGNKVLVELDWTIDKELFAQCNFDGASWNIVAIRKDVPDPSGRVRLGWEVVAIASFNQSNERSAPVTAIARALKAFGYSNGRGHDDDVPVSFNLK